MPQFKRNRNYSRLDGNPFNSISIAYRYHFLFARNTTDIILFQSIELRQFRLTCRRGREGRGEGGISNMSANSHRFEHVTRLFGAILAQTPTIQEHFTNYQHETMAIDFPILAATKYYSFFYLFILFRCFRHTKKTCFLFRLGRLLFISPIK